MTMTEIRAEIHWYRQGMLGHMVKLGMLESKYAGHTNGNGNKVFNYSIPGKKDSAKVEVEKRLTLQDVWPVHIPSTDAKPVIVPSRLDVDHWPYSLSQSYGGIKSCVPYSMLMCGE